MESSPDNTPAPDPIPGATPSEPPKPTEALCEVSDSTLHGNYIDGDFQIIFTVWREAWLESHVCHTPRFASLFRLPPEVVEYSNGNKVLDNEGHFRASIAGWRDATPGMVALDIDRENNLDAAHADLKKVLTRLELEGVSEDAYKIFFSGSKGFAIHLLAEAFGEEMAKIPPTHSLRQHERAVLLAIKAVAGGVLFDPTARETIRLFRLPNSAHQKTGLYKIPLNRHEAMTLTMDQIKDLAKAPRTDLPIVPSACPDPGLARLLSVVAKSPSETEKERRDAEASRSNSRLTGAEPVPAQRSTTSPPTLIEPQNSQGLLKELRDLVNPSNPVRFRQRLRDAWHGVPVPRRNNSSSEHDWRFVCELFIMGWPIDKVKKALWLRPGNKAEKSGRRGSKYVEQTCSKALDHVTALKSKSPVHQARQDVKPLGEITQSWLYHSAIWKPVKGLGKSAQAVYFFHLNTAKEKADFKPLEGHWSKTYYLSMRTIASPELGVASAKTIARAHALLRAIGLLKLIRMGRGDQASTWQLTVPRREQEADLVQGVESALQLIRGSNVSPFTRKGFRTIAKAARESKSDTTTGPTGEVARESQASDPAKPRISEGCMGSEGGGVGLAPTNCP